MFLRPGAYIWRVYLVPMSIELFALYIAIAPWS